METEENSVSRSQPEENSSLVFCNAVLRGYSQYLIGRYGAARYRAFLEEVDVTDEWINDVKNWHSIDFAERYYKALRNQYKEDPNIVSACVRSVFEDSRQKFFASFLGVILTPERFFSILPSAVRRMNRYNIFEKGSVFKGVFTTTGHLIQRSIPNSSGYLDEVMAEAGLVSIRCNFEILGYKVMSARLIKTPKRDGYAELEVTWVNKSTWQTTVLGFATFGALFALFYLYPDQGFDWKLLFSISAGITVASIFQYFKLRRRLDHVFAYQAEALDELREAGGVTKRLNEELINYQREMAKAFSTTTIDDFGFSIVHDMASPMTLLNFYAQQIHAGAKGGEMDNEKLNKYADSISKASKRLMRLQKLFAEARKSRASDRIVTIDLIQLIRDTKELFEPYVERHDVQFSFETSEESLEIETFEGALESVVLNLTQNSLNALNKVDARRLSITVRKTEENIELTLADSGPGIPPERIENLWQKFGHTEGGTGFGMSHVKTMVDKLQGTIDVESSIAGTRFHIQIPVRVALGKKAG